MGKTEGNEEPDGFRSDDKTHGEDNSNSEDEFDDSILCCTNYEDLRNSAEELREIIDKLNSDFMRAIELIVQLARKMDENSVCRRDEICRHIKNILQDKIKNGKISERWIEENLPSEYKRHYTPKSEESSELRKKNDQNLIQENDRKFSDSLNDTEYQPNWKAEDTNESGFGIPEKLGEDSTNYIVTKEKKNLIIKALRKCRKFCRLTFNKSGVLVDVRADVATE
jgi:hypothetical protein